MGGQGFGQGLTQGLQQAQDRQLQMQHLKLQQDFAKYQQKTMETQDQLHQLQLGELQKKIEAETRLPSMQENLLGPQGGAMNPGAQGPMPEAAPEIDRRKLASFLQAASAAGQDPEQVLHLMGMADPRIAAIAETLKPETFTKIGEGEQLISNKTKQPVAKGPAKAHVMTPGSTLFREGEQNVQAPAAPEKPLVLSPGQTVMLPDGQSFTLPGAPEKPMVVPPGASIVKPGETTPSFTAPMAPAKPVAVSPGQSLVQPETGQTVFTAPEAPSKPMSVAPGGTVIDPKTGNTIFTAPPGSAKPPDFGDRLESLAASYGQTHFGRATTFTELLTFDPIQAAKLRDQAMVTEPATIAAGKLAATIPERKNELLSPTEANELGVPFGTTKGQAQGVMPITAHQRESLAGYDTSRTIIADIKQYSEKINTEAGGITGKAQQAMKLWGAWTQSNPDAALLNSKIGELASVARSLGEKGALANQDVARAAALVPTVLDTREVAQKKIKDMMAIIDHGEANFRKSLGLDARAPMQSSKAPSVKEPPPDPLASIPVPQGLTPQQEKVYREAYAAERARKQQQMNGKTNAKPQR